MTKPSVPRWKIEPHPDAVVLVFHFHDVRLSRDETKQLIRDLTNALSEAPVGAG